MTAGVARTADPGRSGGAAFGVPSGVASKALQALRRPGVTVPRRFDLPHWLPQRTGPSKPTNTSAPPAAPAAIDLTGAAGVGLRSEFGSFGLSDADDSLLYADCTPFELCEEPPDPGVAASATSIVQSVNELILLVNRATNGSRVIPNFDFFALDNNQVAQSDPRVLYDAARGRWLATEISSDCGHGYLYMAVSSSDDPFGVWTVYRIVFPGRVVDFPGVGTSNDKVVVSLNAFGADPASPNCLSPGDFEGGLLVVVDWSDLEKNVASLPATTTPPDPKLFTWRPAAAAGADSPAHLVVAIDNGTDETADVGYATVSGTNAGRDVTVSTVINLTTDQGLARFETPPPPRQPGKPATIVHALDGQPTDAIWASGHLWFISTTPCTPAGDDTIRDCVRLTELVTGTSSPQPSVGIASDTVLREKGADLYMAGVGRALDGTLYLVYTRSSPQARIAGWATWRPASESTFREPVLLIPPAGIYSGTRWGDYVILSTDPSAPDAVWQTNQVASVDGTWFTWMSRLRPAAIGPLAGSMRINGGDAFAAETFVELQFANPPDVALMVVRVANDPATQDGVLSGGQTMPVADDLPWSLAIDKPATGSRDGTHTVYVQWGDGLGHWSTVVSDSVVLDTTAPTIGAVEAPRIGTSALGPRGSVPVEIRWGAGRDALSGLEGYDVEISTDGGDWLGFASATQASATGRVLPGHRYRWRVRSFDRLGNESAWQVSTIERIDALDDASTSIRYGGGWHGAALAGAYRGGVHTTHTAGASATFSFTGRGFALAGSAGPGRGTIEVFVDGGRVGRFVEGQSLTRIGRIGFRHAFASGRHTVSLVALDGRQVDLDAVILVR
jgi:hypothetical protein